MIDSVIAAMENANQHTRETPYDLSSWIRKAIADKLAHLARSKRSLRGRQTAELLIADSQTSTSADVAQGAEDFAHRGDDTR